MNVSWRNYVEVIAAFTFVIRQSAGASVASVRPSSVFAKDKHGIKMTIGQIKHKRFGSCSSID